MPPVPSHRMTAIRMLRVAVLGVAASIVFASAAPAGAATGDIGFPDHVYSPLGGSPTGSKPESKLWFNRGWWATMFDPASGTHHIFKLNRATETWTDTKTVVDTRTSTRADTLWDPTAAGGAGKLYVASHTWTTSPATGSPGRLFRYSYDAATDRYTLDAGFPVDINTVKTETLVIDKDSTGMLWATWMVGNQIFVNHTTGSDNQWSTPKVVPGGGTTVSSDDISSVIHFGGDKIGVMWSNQVDHHFWFAIHRDGDPDTTWTSSSVPFAFLSDDHINLKTDAAGRVYAAVKTSETSGTRPLIALLVRSSTGTWSNFTLGTVSDSNTRPIVEIDEEAGVIHTFETGPSPPNRSGQSGGTIYEKTSPIGPIAFATGLGKPVIREAAFADMNDATSTKQNVNAATGIVVMANNATSLRYWHYDSAPGAAPSLPPPAPVADFTADRTTGQAPLSVQFTDASTGTPTSWQWTFGDGTTSTQQSPTHVYQAAGTYDVSLTATNANGSNTKTKVGFVTVSATAPAPGGTTVTIPPSADAQVSEVNPTSNYGALTTLRVRLISAGSYHSYLRFVVSGLTGPVTSAKLRLTVTDASPDGGRVYVTDPNWIESGSGGITWNTAPALPEPSFATVAASTAVGQVVEADLGSRITGNGTYSFGLASSSTNSAIYGSRESTTPPQLVLTTG
jgi:PKD repeat protein